MENVKIKKASIKDELFLSVEYTEELPGHSKKETALSCTIPVHQDLKDAFKVFNKHLAVLCDEVRVKGSYLENYDHEVFDKYEVTGISITGVEDNEKVQLNGGKEVKHGWVNLNSPKVKWESSDYAFLDELSEATQHLIYEVEQYLFHGKRAPEPQMAMDFGEEDPIVEEGR